MFWWVTKTRNLRFVSITDGGCDTCLRNIKLVWHIKHIYRPQTMSVTDVQLFNGAQHAQDDDDDGCDDGVF